MRVNRFSTPRALGRVVNKRAVARFVGWRQSRGGKRLDGVRAIDGGWWSLAVAARPRDAVGHACDVVRACNPLRCSHPLSTAFAMFRPGSRAYAGRPPPAMRSRATHAGRHRPVLQRPNWASLFSPPPPARHANTMPRCQRIPSPRARASRVGYWLERTSERRDARGKRIRDVPAKPVRSAERQYPGRRKARARRGLARCLAHQPRTPASHTSLPGQPQPGESAAICRTLSCRPVPDVPNR